MKINSAADLEVDPGPRGSVRVRAAGAAVAGAAEGRHHQGIGYRLLIVDY